jgi:23S rRNA (cytidine1920-2'-O)/16S rRNA (cytidine1409-2'-O)-methyltransferase
MRLRLDEELVRRGLYASRARARDAVQRGTVSINGVKAAKPAQLAAASDQITLEDAARNYVSRAALKLLHGLDHFSLSPKGANALDVGASTGGFTQVLLERGAARVTALDVGHGQLADNLKSDPRVIPLEGFNARDLTRADLAYAPDFLVCDVSFISLKLALAPALALATPQARLIALVKPQFEAGRDHIGKGGIVRDDAAQQAVCDEIARFVMQTGWRVIGLTPSPVEGGDGNKEFLLAAEKAA